MFMFLCFFELASVIFLLARYGRETDWHILFRSMFSMFTMYLGITKVAYRKPLKAKTITINNITLPVIASTICKSTNTLHMQTLNNSVAKELISTQDANKCATWMLDTKDKKTDLQSIVKDKCKHLSANPWQRSYCSFSCMSCFLTAP